MEDRNKQRMFFKLAAATAAVLSAFGLAACGGGGGGEANPAPAKAQESAATAHIAAEGKATPLSSELTTVKVLHPPVTWSADGSMPQGKARIGTEENPSVLQAISPGAYTTLPFDGGALSLSRGIVTDIGGNGHFAIGRWTAGSDSAGYSYNVNQGRVWALGAPLSEPVTVGEGMRCELAAATRPTASDGNTAPGALASASADLTEGTDPFGQSRNVASLKLRYSIGSDHDQTFTDDVSLGAMVLTGATRSSLATTFFGPDASKPYLVVSYGVHAPTVGLINGIAVFSCARPALQQVEQEAAASVASPVLADLEE
ncbi:MAG: hypothetical protein ACTHNZ_02765 [Trinickia sp.]|uniref:hypothetical protein n=1 Tax=Trinickia sp. TaxID=2571163 RepID=UPI003F82242F